MQLKNCQVRVSPIVTYTCHKLCYLQVSKKLNTCLSNSYILISTTVTCLSQQFLKSFLHNCYVVVSTIVKNLYQQLLHTCINNYDIIVSNIRLIFVLNLNNCYVRVSTIVHSYDYITHFHKRSSDSECHWCCEVCLTSV